MTVRRHRTATMPAFWFCFPTVRLLRQKQSHVLGRDDVGKHFLLQCMRQLGASHSSSQPLDLHRDLKLSPRATSHSLSLVPPLCCFLTHSLCTAHAPFRSGDFLLTPYPSLSSWNLTLATGWWGRWQKKAHLSLICVVPGSIPRCLAETP